MIDRKRASAQVGAGRGIANIPVEGPSEPDSSYRIASLPIRLLGRKGVELFLSALP